MPLGIRPTVDFAFKMLFGNTEHTDILIDMLNAVLRPDCPIEEVEILNPINDKAFEDDKLSVVDVKARDAQGNWYVIEVQTTLPAGLQNRLAYYTSGLYYGQLRSGKGYVSLRPAISICFLTQSLFPDVLAGNLQFGLYDNEHKLSFGDQIQIHLIELPKYNIAEADLADAAEIEKWIFFLKSAAVREAGDLRRLLPEAVYQNATGVLEMITRSPDLRLVYDDRAKEEQDRIALRVDSLAEGEARGEARGEAKGEARGEARGKLVGQIQLLHRLLKLEPIDEPELAKMDPGQLEALLTKLEAKLG